MAVLDLRDRRHRRRTHPASWGSGDTRIHTEQDGLHTMAVDTFAVNAGEIWQELSCLEAGKEGIVVVLQAVEGQLVPQ